MPTREREKHDLLSTKHTGIRGAWELVYRRFTVVTRLVTLIPVYVMATACMGLAATPGMAVVIEIYEFSAGMALPFRAILLGPAVAFAYFFYGFSLILILPTVNFLLRTRPRPWRGSYKSVELIPWFIHNGLTYIARYTFLELVTPSPMNTLFYRLMGMKIGQGTEINSTHISDPALIELGKRVTIGGSAALIGHYGAGGYIVIAKIVIGDGATIGLRAIVMGGATIGANAKVLANSVVLPKTVVGAGETWGGVPARKLERSELVTAES